jgi:hypothetical protein
MKWVNRLSFTLLGLIGIGAVRNFLDKYYLLVLDKEEVEEDMEEPNPMDLRGTPTHVCVCGSNQFMVRAIFDNYEIATYFLDMICVSCGSLLTAPTPVDREEMGQ